MTKDKIFIFDTTLRDGAQTQGVDFSIDDKIKIAHALDSLGVDYIEGGWPGANPTDTEFFQKKIKLNNLQFPIQTRESESQNLYLWLYLWILSHKLSKELHQSRE